MVIVIVAWIFYMNIFVFQSGVSGSENGTRIEPVNIEFWPVFKTGLKTIARNVDNKVNYWLSEILFRISKITGGQKLIEIKNSQ